LRATRSSKEYLPWPPGVCALGRIRSVFDQYWS
jgi:hypothetical protein